MPPNALARFERRLALADYFLHLFGLRDVREAGAVRRFYTSLAELPEGYDEEAGGLSYVAQHLRPLVRGIPASTLAEYDRNVRRHFESIARHQPDVVTLKYFQVLAALMTEHYLTRYFKERPTFLRDLNEWVGTQNTLRGGDPYPAFTAGDLNKVAFWMATGSGKTLLMHLNLLQYRHHVRPASPNNSLLITPDEGLSRQHLEAFRQSRIPAVPFNAQQTLLGEDRQAVKVIEIHKLREQRSGGGASIEVASLERDNLVLVDEGHKGSASDTQSWRKLRSEAARDGFTFEYSATFGQAIVGKREVEEEYSKTILFNYAYRHFHADGYGKDYRILNLERELDAPHQGLAPLTRRYLLANLLTFYEQRRLFAAEQATVAGEYHIAAPLLVFIGHSVNLTGTLGATDRQAFSDVLTITHFLHDVLRNRDGWVPTAIDQILDGTAGLQDEAGRDLFAGAFPTLRAAHLTGAVLYPELLASLFHVHAPTDLHLVNLKRANGEIGLRAGESDAYFGVINIGDDRRFLELAAQQAPDLTVTEEQFSDSLFERVNRPDSTVTTVIGARKFIEGWDSWRVSTMGLMNFGRQAGPLIIQLFGRGVRLLGRGRTLKRSRHLPGLHPERIALLETLQIFGVRASYMRAFQEYLAKEGIDSDPRDIVVVPTRPTPTVPPAGLLLVRPHAASPFEATPPFRFRASEALAPVLDLTVRLTALGEGQAGEAVGGVAAPPPRRLIPPPLLDLLDWHRLYRELWHWTRAVKGYGNLVLDPTELRTLFARGWYDLYGPAEMLAPRAFADLRALESIVVRLAQKAISRFYSDAYRRWEDDQLRYEPLKADDPNLIPHWEAAVKRSATALRAALEAMQAHPEWYTTDAELPQRVYLDRHLYQPLLVQPDEADPPVTYSPPGLNPGEYDFVRALRDFCQSADGDALLAEWELYLLRNQSRGLGVGFLVGDQRYFPDFLLWLRRPDHQHLAFIDPKGLVTGGNLLANPKVQFHRTLRDHYQPLLNAKAGRNDITLHAFLISQTPFHSLRHNQDRRFQTREGFYQQNIYFREDDPIRRLLATMSG